MPFEYTEEQKSLITLFERSLADLCTSTFLRGYRENPTFHAQLIDTFTELGFFEYVKDPQCSLIDLMLIARECGRVLSPMSALYRGYLEYLQLHDWKDSEPVQGIAFSITSLPFFILEKRATSVLVIPEGGLVRSNSQIQSAAINNIQLHESIDITDLSYKGEIDSDSARPLPTELSVRVRSEVAALISAELCGIAEHVVQLTANYVKTRKQYGSPVGSFQAVQQQLADCYLHSEAATALMECAGTSEFSSRAALMYAVKHVPSIIETCLQLHGGIGFTWEYDLHLYLRRSLKLASLTCVNQDSLIDTLSLVS